MRGLARRGRRDADFSGSTPTRLRRAGNPGWTQRTVFGISTPPPGTDNVLIHETRAGAPRGMAPRRGTARKPGGPFRRHRQGVPLRRNGKPLSTTFLTHAQLLQHLHLLQQHRQQNRHQEQQHRGLLQAAAVTEAVHVHLPKTTSQSNRFTATHRHIYLHLRVQHPVPQQSAHIHVASNNYHDWTIEEMLTTDGTLSMPTMPTLSIQDQ